ncbi:MAG: calcium-binding protein [Cyanobacteria bacterium P01_C01_bin.121]
MPSVDEILQRVQSRTARIQSRVRTGQNALQQVGTNRRDFLVADTSEDSVLIGLGGNDRLFGRFGNDSISGGAGKDIIDGGFGDDFIQGDGGDDQLFGKFGNDQIFGGGGDDLIDGGADDDSLDGGRGDDVISGAVGSDRIIGGAGSDILIGGSNSGTGNPLEIDQLIGGRVNANGFPVFDDVSDVFVLGDDSGLFYKEGGFEDYAILIDFEPGVDQLDFGQAAGNLSVEVGAFITPFDSAIFEGNDLIAVVLEVDITA